MTEQTKERPILFKGEMVRAILDGRKTQTRRIVKLENGLWRNTKALHMMNPEIEWHRCEVMPIDGPYGCVGDRLWVRETFALSPSGKPIYRANYRGDTSTASTIDLATGETGPLVWKPSIFMPRWASRITLEIVNVRVERLQRIGGTDAIAEGIALDKLADNGYWKNYEFTTAHPRRNAVVTDEKHRIVGYRNPVDSYRSLWQSINGAGSWDANPWVWVVEFKKL